MNPGLLDVCLNTDFKVYSKKSGCDDSKEPRLNDVVGICAAQQQLNRQQQQQQGLAVQRMQMQQQQQQQPNQQQLRQMLINQQV